MRRLRDVHFSPVMLALCLMVFSTYYAQNYAGIIGAGLELCYYCSIYSHASKSRKYVSSTHVFYRPSENVDLRMFIVLSML